MTTVENKVRLLDRAYPQYSHLNREHVGAIDCSINYCRNEQSDCVYDGFGALYWSVTAGLFAVATRPPRGALAGVFVGTSLAYGAQAVYCGGCYMSNACAIWRLKRYAAYRKQHSLL
jgi:hypothetical protein